MRRFYVTWSETTIRRAQVAAPDGDAAGAIAMGEVGRNLGVRIDAPRGRILCVVETEPEHGTPRLVEGSGGVGPIKAGRSAEAEVREAWAL